MAIRKVKKDFAPTSDFLDLDAEIRKYLSTAISRSPKSRLEITEQLSAEVGTHISVRMLDQFTAQSRHRYRFPAAWVIPFCRITGNDALQRLLLGAELGHILRVGEAELVAHRIKRDLDAGLANQPTPEIKQRRGVPR